MARPGPRAMQVSGMATPAERKALAFLAAIAALGVAVRGIRAARERRADAVSVTALARQIAAVDSASGAQAARKRQKAPPARPSGRAPVSAGAAPSTRVDLDEAGAADIATIPGIGPVLAARIVEDRSRRGPFGSLAGLQRVKGIGPALAGRIDRYVRFSHPLAAPPVVIEFPRLRRRAKSP